MDPDVFDRFTIEVNEGRNQFGVRCNICGYQFVQSWRTRGPMDLPIPDGVIEGEMSLRDIVEMAIEHDTPGNGVESCERYDVAATA